MIKPGRHIIWSNEDLDFDAWKEILQEDYPEITDENELYSLMLEQNDELIYDERENLNIQLNEPILVIGELGLWNGRRQGYKEIESGNIKDCLYSNYDYTTWYVDNKGDFRCDDTHHDGTNHYLYRAWKENTSEDQRDDLRDKLYHGTAKRADVERYTERLGDKIGEVYGWEFPERKQREHER